jgi:uncharacterized protein YoxC
MEYFLVVVQIIAFIALTILCVYLLTLLSRVKNILTVVESDVKEISAKIVPVMNNLEAITDKIRRVTENIDEQVELAKSSIQSMKEIADSIVSFERQVQSRIEEPVMESIGMIAAVFKGVRTFIARLRE